MSHPQIEEISDSDPEEMDPSDFLPSNSGPAIMSIASSSSLAAPSSTSSVLPHHPAPRPAAGGGAASGANAAQQAQAAQQARAMQQQQQQREMAKTWHCVYPVYFDARRTRAQGRRVDRENAVDNPLAREILDAVEMLGLPGALEAGKSHPKDWANPGRVKVEMKGNANRGELWFTLRVYFRPTLPLTFFGLP